MTVTRKKAPLGEVSTTAKVALSKDGRGQDISLSGTSTLTEDKHLKTN